MQAQRSKRQNIKSIGVVLGNTQIALKLLRGIRMKTVTNISECRYAALIGNANACLSLHVEDKFAIADMSTQTQRGYACWSGLSQQFICPIKLSINQINRLHEQDAEHKNHTVTGSKSESVEMVAVLPADGNLKHLRAWTSKTGIDARKKCNSAFSTNTRFLLYISPFSALSMAYHNFRISTANDCSPAVAWFRLSSYSIIYWWVSVLFSKTIHWIHQYLVYHSGICTWYTHDGSVYSLRQTGRILLLSWRSVKSELYTLSVQRFPTTV